MSIDIEKVKSAQINGLENTMIDNLKTNLFRVKMGHIGNPETDLGMFFEYCVKGKSTLINGIWKNQFPHQILNGQKFIDAITESFEALIEKKLENPGPLNLPAVYIPYDNKSSSVNFFSIGRFTNTDYFYYNLNMSAFYYSISAEEYHLYLSPIFVRNVLCSSKCNVKTFIKKVMSYIDNAKMNSLAGHILYATLAKYLGEYCSNSELQKIEKLLLTHLSSESIENYYYHDYWAKAGAGSENAKNKIMYKKYAESLAALNVEFVKAWKGADVKAHTDYIINYCDSVCHAYNLALVITDNAEAENTLLQIANYVGHNVSEEMSNKLIEQLQKPMGERKQVYFIPEFGDEYFVDESYRKPNFKEIMEKARKLEKNKKK